MSGEVDSAELDQEAVLAWWATRARDLPWRRTRDPWAVLVSEVMLQQTQVERVTLRHQRFLARFPTPAACGGAPMGDVIEEWSGLGYNRRARDLHRAATIVTAEHGGAVPADLDALLGLPGVGPYTARAVLAFAHEAEHGVVDTNVARVLSRHEGTSLTPSRAQARADGLVPAGRAWAWNQAMIDLGAGVCVAHGPRCDRCPLSATCGWRRAGRPEPDPADRAVNGRGRTRPFEGSDRQGRGRLVTALTKGPVDRVGLPAVMGWPADQDRAERVAATVVADGLAQWSGSTLALP